MRMHVSYQVEMPALLALLMEHRPAVGGIQCRMRMAVMVTLMVLHSITSSTHVEECCRTVHQAGHLIALGHSSSAPVACDTSTEATDMLW